MRSDPTRTVRLRQFYEEQRQSLFTYALALTGDRTGAEDAVHTAMEKLVDRSRLPRELRPYAFRCIRNAVIDAWRRTRRERERESILALNGHCPAHSNRELAVRAAALLDQLNDDEREVIVLKLFDDLTFREIATIRRVSLHTVASQYRRGFAKLRKLFQKESK